MTQAFSQERENSPQENDIREFSGEKNNSSARLFESMEIFSNEIKMRLSQEMDSLMSLMHSQVNRVRRSAINERVVLERQNILGSLS